MDSLFDFDFGFDFRSRFRFRVRFFRSRFSVPSFDSGLRFRCRCPISTFNFGLSSAPIFGSEIGSGYHLRVFGLLRSPLWGAVPLEECMVDEVG